MKNKWYWLFSVAIFLLVVTIAGLWWKYVTLENTLESKNQKENQADSWPQFDKVRQAYDIITSNYVERIDGGQLTEGAIKGMLGELKDPYSVYMDEETSSQFQQTLDSRFQGIGAEISFMDGKFIIVSPFKNSPAERSGIKPGDEIIRIDSKDVKGLELYDVVSLIRGKIGTKVTIDIKRNGNDQPITFLVERDEIPIETIHTAIKKVRDKKIGYIQITSFSEETAEDFLEDLKGLEEDKVDGLLIDVRGNPGGLLTSVQEILEVFVTNEHPYIQIQERNGKKNKFFSTLKSEKEYPIAVLINKGSASASEIFAGAMQEAEGYPLIGEKTFGKGTVQQPVSMGDGSTIKLTFYKWLTPNGTWIHKKGIAPTMSVHQDSYYTLQPLVVTEDLRKDMNNKQVKTLQQMLEGLGYAPGRTDGYFSSKTEKAVLAFQRMHKLPVTGSVDQDVAAKLQQAVVDKIKDEKNDRQLQTGLSWLAQQ
ncbi:PDZ domain-containing protein [Pradoshia sp. D12]|uniref:S41 family peptidase n=1 Tax=Bacillaceae TaxID=186817 RepID=UPI00112E757C|nr:MULTISPECIES: S41 family peptidase [Bacillaceae]QFK72843.1 PDZ domain-containing protein [Pradoshia sp. D12]TPF71836.1 PDZ domain-containing protein [Bacillus sp. D12]